MERLIKSEFILKDDVRRLLDDFAALMKLRAVFFSADGTEIERGRDADCSDYCRLMQQERFGIASCHRKDAEKRAECRRRGEILHYTCHAGLGEIIAPVKVFGEVAGFIVLGQFRIGSETPPFAMNDTERAAYDTLPVFSGDDLKNLLHMLNMLIEYVVSKELVSFPEDLRMLRLNQYVERHLADKITLRDAARALACSESTLTHYLRRERNTTFIAFVIGKRLDAAKKMLTENPPRKLADIASATGFADQHYFSRIFRKYCGVTPGSLRK